jgi:hypothetical protein
MQSYALKKSKGFILLCCCLLFACSPQCDEEIQKIFQAAEAGEVESLRTYLEDGGDPMLHCTDYRSGGKGIWPDRSLGQGVHFLHQSVQEALSPELMAVYLQYEVPQHIKDEMLADGLAYLPAEKEEINRILLKQGARLSDFPAQYSIFDSDRKALRRAHKLGYDFNWQDPEGNTLMMKYAQLDLYSTKAKAIEILETSLEDQEAFQERLERKEERVEELIQTLELLIANGARTDLRNKRGQTAADLAFHDAVKACLKQPQP